MTSPKDDLARIIAEVSKLLDEARRYHVQQAEKHGYALDLFRKLPTVVQSLSEGQCQSLTPTVETFLSVVQAKERYQSDWDISSGAFVVSGTLTSSAVIAPVKLAELNRYIPEHPLNWSPERSQQYATRLRAIEPETSKVYRSVAEAFWGSTENAERIALFQARQCFDQLFAYLAPDDAVRASQFFQKKPPPKDMQVHRKERILYAAHTHVRDKAQAAFLVEQADALLRVYDDLQRAHERAALSREETRLTLETAIASLDQWIDALRG